MPGFAHMRDWAEAHYDGRVRTATIRKVPAQAATARAWVDLSMAPGIPYPNYYASEPLVGATLNGWKGICHGADVAPATKWLSYAHLVPSAAGLTGHYVLLDYLLYYPFIDLDAVGEEQVFDNSVTLPRYADGAGVEAFLVAVAPTTGAGVFTFNYVDQDGVPQTSAAHTMPTSSVYIASVITALAGTASTGYGPFLRLNQGNTGIRSVTSVTMSTGGGGLAALVLAYPLAEWYLAEAAAVAEYIPVRQQMPVQVHDGAYLSLLCQCTSSPSGVLLVGGMRFAFSEA